MNKGFTLTEILIVLAIIIVILMIVLVNLRTQISKAYDAERKADLHKIQKSFNEYYNDHSCYPPLTILNNCGSADLAPYLPKVPCDPQTGKPYLYQPVDDTNLCLGYRLLSGLANLSDPDITGAGCSPVTGCGYGALYNWGISEGGSVVGTGFSSGPTPTPLGTTPPPGTYACAPGGTCNSYGDPQGSGCPITFADRYCLNMCANSTYWCAQ